MNSIITGEIVHFVGRYHEDHNTQTRWGEPLVAFADADDPMFSEHKTAVRETHSLPRDLLKTARSVPSQNLRTARPEALTRYLWALGSSV